MNSLWAEDSESGRFKTSRLWWDPGSLTEVDDSGLDHITASVRMGPTETVLAQLDALCAQAKARVVVDPTETAIVNDEEIRALVELEVQNRAEERGLKVDRVVIHP